MLPAKNRLKLKKDFERVFKEGKGYKENCLYLKLVKNNLESSRFGFAVGKKYSNKATLRNKIKRRLREIIRPALPDIKKGADAVIVVLPGAEMDNFQELDFALKKLFKKAKLI